MRVRTSRPTAPAPSRNPPAARRTANIEPQAIRRRPSDATSLLAGTKVASLFRPAPAALSNCRQYTQSSLIFEKPASEAQGCISP